nr:HDOD domain-containing protein [Methylomarinum sp. Ch1-1]MDP4520529.1 HDOD domain-containing protein [Methylomarinum sp. Ch1-1]
MVTSLQSDLTVSDLLKGDLQLASPPAIYFELKKVIEDPHKSMTDAAFVIEKDAALALKLLKIVNSAFYGFPSRISSVNRAVTIIGLQELQNLILGAVIIERFSDLPGDIISMHDFWARSLKCALISRELDDYLGREYCDAVFLCGLLHDIGQLVFFAAFPN